MEPCKHSIYLCVLKIIIILIIICFITSCILIFKYIKKLYNQIYPITESDTNTEIITQI